MVPRGPMEWEFVLSTLISLFAIINPMGAVPNYAALTQGFSVPERRRVVKKAVIVALVILIIFTLIGRFIFDFLNITVDAFRVAGGIVLFMIALDRAGGFV